MDTIWRIFTLFCILVTTLFINFFFPLLQCYSYYFDDGNKDDDDDDCNVYHSLVDYSDDGAQLKNSIDMHTNIHHKNRMITISSQNWKEQKEQVSEKLPDNEDVPNHDPMYDPNLFEGDIIPTWDYIVNNYSLAFAEKLAAKGIIHKPTHAPDEVDAIITTRGTEPTIKLWRNTMINDVFIIPIFISSSFLPYEKQKLKSTLNKLAHQSGVIQFQFIYKQYKDGTPFLHIKNGQGCSSDVGRNGEDSYQKRGQIVNLNSKFCFNTRIIQHEIMHALGFQHEQSRPDRDDYVTIRMKNIKNGLRVNFHKETSVNSLGSPYDFKSIMHYRSNAFSKNGEDTIIPKNGNTIIISDSASINDIQQLRLMYQCTSGPRSRAQYYRKLCTKDCKCWFNANGCKGKDYLCKGNLICRNNKCIQNPSPKPVDKPIPMKSLVKYNPHGASISFMGVVFDIETKHTKLKIENLILSIDTKGPKALQIYSKIGSGVGYETSPSAWKLMNTFSYRGDGTPYPEPFPIGIFQPVVMAPFTKRSFLITFTQTENNHFRTTMGQSYGSGVYKENQHLRIKEGCGIHSPFIHSLCSLGSFSYTIEGGIQYALWRS